jgi:NAD(P)-dependent dehydrogenase (short-subunit alcohol dehydrogenase family)
VHYLGVLKEGDPRKTVFDGNVLLRARLRFRAQGRREVGLRAARPSSDHEPGGQLRCHRTADFAFGLSDAFGIARELREEIGLTSSTQGQHGTKYGAAYAASKWGIIGLMKSAALELGPHRITVNAVIPGLIDTPLTRHQERYAQVLQDGGGTPTGSDEEAAKKILATKTPLGVPWIDPVDVAPVVVFLASEAARMVSGAAYDVTAGDSARNTA